MNKKGTVASVLFLMTLIQLSVDIYLPSTLFIVKDLHTTIANVQLTFFVFLLTAGLSQLIYGPLMDRFGRKPFLMGGALLFFLTSLLETFTHSIVILIVARAFQGIGAAVFSVGSRSTLRDILTHEEFKKTSIYQGISWSLVPIFAPVLGSYIQHYFGWRYNFGILAFAGLLAAILTFWMRESAPKLTHSLHPLAILKSYGQILIHAKFWPFIVGTISDSILLAMFYLFAPILLQGNLRLSVLQYGWIMFYIALSALIAMIINRLWIYRLQDRMVLLVSATLCVCSGILLIIGCYLQAHLVTYFMIAMMLMQIGMSWLFPLCISHAMKPMQQHAGKAAAIVGCGNMGGSSISALIIAYIVIRSEWAFSLIFLAITLFLLWIFWKKTSRICA